MSWFSLYTVYREKFEYNYKNLCRVVEHAHCSKLEKVLDENVTPQFEYFPFIWALVMSKLAIWLNSVGIQGHKDKKTVKKGQIWSFLANFDLVLPLKFWMPTDFNNLAYFGINNVQMNEKCWNQGVTFSSRTIFHFEQCGWWQNSSLTIHSCYISQP